MTMTALQPTADSTRERLIAQARALFAERGFYGVSIAQIAAELGLTKQALLHHFGTKEKLYGQVLASIADEYALLRQSLDREGPAQERLTAYLLALVAQTPQEIERARLLMRELLDNPDRAETAGAWYLKPFLKDLLALLGAVPGWQQAPESERMAALIQLLGAINYHAVSGPTFRGIFGAQASNAMQRAYVPQLEATIASVLARGTRPQTARSKARAR
jgi:AcrR family transcriptional regulator